TFRSQGACAPRHWLVSGRRSGHDLRARIGPRDSAFRAEQGHKMNANLRNFALWVIILLLLLALFSLFQNPRQRTTSQDISFSQLLTEVDAGRVRDVLIQGPEIHGNFNDGRAFQTYAPNDPSLIQRLYGKG